MNPFLLAFNTLALKFNDELIDTFPEEPDFKVYRTGLNFIISNNKKKVCELFKIYIVMYKENIIKKNEEFFLNNTYDELINNDDKQGIELIIQKLKNNWNTLSKNNKDQIWEYLISLIKLSDRC